MEISEKTFQKNINLVNPCSKNAMNLHSSNRAYYHESFIELRWKDVLLRL